jgi:hypothetical protein
MNDESNGNMSENEEIMPMNCEQFAASVDDLDRGLDGDLDGASTRGREVREMALTHAESCSRCARLMNDVESLDFSLQRIAAQDAMLQAPPRVEAALLQELRAQKAVTSRKKGQWRMAAVGIAAMVLLTMGVAARHVLMKGADTGTAEIAGLPASSAGSQKGASANVSATAATEGTEVAENVSTDSADSTAFVALPYATDPGTLDGGTVVRVELSRAALASMGMPVTDAGSYDRIPADIMLSEDGAPQAIRLVSTASYEQ